MSLHSHIPTLHRSFAVSHLPTALRCLRMHPPALQIMRRGVPMELVSAERLKALVEAIEAEKEAEGAEGAAAPKEGQ